MESPRRLPAPPGPLRTHRIALVGAGQGVRERHLPAYARAERLEVVALQDRDPELVAHTADAFGIADVCTALEDVLAMDHVDVIDVAVPLRIRAAVTRRVLDAGKHALVQGPLTRGLAEARELVEQARTAGVQLAVRAACRFEPTLWGVRQMLASGELGRPLSTFLEHRQDEPGPAHARDGDDRLLERAFAKLDLLQAWFGPPETIHASFGTAGRMGFRGPSTGLFTLGFRDGHQAVVLEDLAPSAPGFRRLLVNGSAGALRCDLEQLEFVSRGGLPSAWETLSTQGDPRDACADAMGALCRAIELGTPPEHAAAGQLGTLLALEAVRRSAAEARTIALAELEPLLAA